MPSFGIRHRVVLVRTDISHTVFRRSLHRLVVTPNVVPLVILMMQVLRSSETSVLTRATRGNIPETASFIVTAGKTSSLTANKKVLSPYHAFFCGFVCPCVPPPPMGARQCVSKHGSKSTNGHAKIEFIDAVFTVRSVSFHVLNI
jgi:hypothetical protein